MGASKGEDDLRIAEVGEVVRNRDGELGDCERLSRIVGQSPRGLGAEFFECAAGPEILARYELWPLTSARCLQDVRDERSSGPALGF